MSHHKLTQSAISTRRPRKRTPEQAAARAAIKDKYGVTTMKRCTAINCPKMAQLVQDALEAQQQARWKDYGALLQQVQEHMPGPSCGTVTK